MAEAALDYLPLEIIHLIFNHLGFNTSSNLIPEPPDAYFAGDEQDSRRVSKRWRSLAQPILYREITLGYGDSKRSKQYTWAGRVVSFMRTVARRPDSAALVKRIHIHPCGFRHIPKVSRATGWLMFESPLERMRITDMVARDVLTELAGAFQLKELGKLTPFDLIAALIIELPNLKRCTFQLQPDSWEIVALDKAHVAAAGISPLLLTTIDVSLCATRDEVEYAFGHFSLVKRVFSLLSVSTRLETLNLHMYYAISRAERGPFPSLPNLKTLRLTHSWLSASSLERLLSSYNHFRLPDAVWHLRGYGHCKTLKSVYLDLRMREPARYSPELPSVSSFQAFTKLKHLFLNLDEFHTQSMALDPGDEDNTQLFATLLPQTLVSLHLCGRIVEDLHRLESSLCGLAEAMLDVQFPTLEQIRWDKNESLSASFPIQTMFAARDVSFEYASWPLSKSTRGETQELGQPSFTYLPPLPVVHAAGIGFDPNWVDPNEEDPDL
ncbi:hypothetical protein BJX65DRAFT_318397 [Aspergillus insuetus]